MSLLSSQTFCDDEALEPAAYCNGHWEGASSLTFLVKTTSTNQIASFFATQNLSHHFIIIPNDSRFDPLRTGNRPLAPFAVELPTNSSAPAPAPPGPWAAAAGAAVAPSRGAAARRNGTFHLEKSPA